MSCPASLFPLPTVGPWVPVERGLPRQGRVVLLHFAWGETSDGWLLPEGVFRTGSQPIPQSPGCVTHWTLPPLGPNSPEEDIEAMRVFCETYRAPHPDDALVMDLPFAP